MAAVLRSAWIVAACTSAFVFSALGWAAPRQDPDPRKVINRAKAKAVTIPKQAEALALLAWPGDGSVDPRVRAEARQDLVDFGKYGLRAMREALHRAGPLYTADIATALIEGRRQAHVGNPQDFLPGLEEVIWYGSVEARRVAIPEMSRFYFPPAVLTIIDAIHENPELGELGIRALGRMGNVRARYFLSDVLYRGDPHYRTLAADALAQLEEAGAASLRSAAESNEPSVREAAVTALLPLAGVDDLTLLHEYIGSHPDDDPGVLESVRQRAIELEAELEEQQLSEAASAEAESGDNP